MTSTADVGSGMMGDRHSARAHGIGERVVLIYIP